MNTFLTQKQRGTFQNIVLKWFKDNQRDLPWRQEYNPYHVWISEIMGQQTQMERVATYFTHWMQRFPTVEAVATAREQDILKTWEGLGYYSRARNIQKTAQLLMERCSGSIPGNQNELLNLPGIGPYTASAILSIAFQQPYPLIDANVERVVARLADIATPLKDRSTRNLVKEVVDSIFYQDDPRSWNQALMEFGALQCRPRKPDCPVCPLRSMCLSRKRGIVHERPVPTKKAKKIAITMACALLRKDDLFFIQQRLPDDIWGGLWEFPGGRVEPGETPEQAVIREVQEETEWVVSEPVPFQSVVHHFTQYRVTLHSFWCKLPETLPPPVLHAASTSTWVPVEELSKYPYPSGHKKLIQLLQ